MTRAIARPLREALAALPAEPDEIADVFTELGITGRRGLPCKCPVANYLKAETGLADVFVGLRCAGSGGSEVDLPEHVRRFVRNFDRGNYPQLVRFITRPEVA